LRDGVVAVGSEVAVLIGQTAGGIGRSRADAGVLHPVPCEGEVAGEDLLDELEERGVVEEVLLGVVGHSTPGGPSSARALRALRASDAPGPRRLASPLSPSASLT